MHCATKKTESTVIGSNKAIIVIQMCKNQSIHSIFCHKHKDTSIHYQVSLPKWRVVCFCWLLFPSPLTINLSGLDPWWGFGERYIEDCVTVKLCGTEWRSLLSLHYHFNWLWALCGPYQDLFHLCLTFFHESLPTIWPPTTYLFSYTAVSGPISVKKNVNWWETCFLATLLEDFF